VRTFLAVILVLTLASLSHAQEVRRLGDGARQVVLADLETAPFPAQRLAGLHAWTGDPLTAEAIEGKVLVVLAWSNDEARSVRLLPSLARLARSMPEDTVFLAVHAKEGWSGARAAIDAGRVPVLCAHDADGLMFSSLRADEHPNLYLIDRAGFVRVADLDPRDLEKGVRLLARETPDSARADHPRRVQRLADLRKREGEPSPGTNMPRTPEAPAVAPDRGPGSPAQPGPAPARPGPEAYLSAPWPEFNRNPINARDVQGRPLPAPLGNETWLTDKPERPLNDHVLVLDFWAIWCGPCLRASPTLDALQTRHPRHLRVLAISGQASGSRFPENPEAIRAHMRAHPVSYAHLNDLNQTIYKRLGIMAIPHAVVISTDGIVRWQGNPLDSRFVSVVEQVLAADPLIAARRAAGD
jgi:thiol-disulfide isomerase/thioredoxin